MAFRKTEDLILSSGIKHDQGKGRWSLLPYDALSAIVQVFTVGAKKYSDRNWEKGMAWSRPYDALHRHMASWWMKEEADSETGLSHLVHAGACILFLIAYEIRKIGTDDRP